MRLLSEGSFFSDSPHKIHELVAIMLAFYQVGDPLTLWGKHRDTFVEDMKGQMEREPRDVQQVMDIVYNKCLILLEDVVFSMSGHPLQPVSYTHLDVYKRQRYVETESVKGR